MRRIVVSSGVALLGLLAAGVYLDGPPPAHTGAFGEASCTACHFDAPVNDPMGRVAVEGLPDSFETGVSYALMVRLERQDLRLGGFQLTTRYFDEPGEGSQAGSLRPIDERVVRDTLGGIQYIRHTVAGAHPVAEDVVAWHFEWHAPERDSNAVVIHVAANAANGDDSEFGDFIYTSEYVLTSR